MNRLLATTALIALLTGGAGIANAQTVAATPTVPPGIGGAAATVGQTNQNASMQAAKPVDNTAPVVAPQAGGTVPSPAVAAPKTEGSNVVAPSKVDPGKTDKTTGKTSMLKSHRHLKTQQVKATTPAVSSTSAIGK